MIKVFKLYGITLIAIGVILTTIFHFIINSAPLSACGISVIILGTTFIALTKNKPKLSDESISKLRNFLISIAIAFAIINVLLAFRNVDDISIYYYIISLAYLTIVIIYLSFNPLPKYALTTVSGVIFVIFLVITAFKLAKIINLFPNSI
jgi:hypothetical protein